VRRPLNRPRLRRTVDAVQLRETRRGDLVVPRVDVRRTQPPDWAGPRAPRKPSIRWPAAARSVLTVTSGFSFRKLFYPIPLTFMRSSDSRRNVYVAELEMRPPPGDLSAGNLARTACSAYARAHGPARYTGAGASGRHPRPRKGLRPARHRSCLRSPQRVGGAVAEDGWHMRRTPVEPLAPQGRHQRC
jgi:hypothetical protein